MLLNEVLSRYGNLPEQDAIDAIEIAVMRVLTRAYKVPFIVRMNGKLEIWRCPPNGDVTEFTPGQIEKKLRRHILHKIEEELRARQILFEADALSSLRGKVVKGTISGFTRQRGLMVEMELVDLFQRLILVGECPLCYQPTHERGRYFVGETKQWYVTGVLPIAWKNHARVLVRLSRTNRDLPAILLRMKSGIDRIVCYKRIPGGICKIATQKLIPKNVINDVGKEVQEHIDVEVLQ